MEKNFFFLLIVIVFVYSDLVFAINNESNYFAISDAKTYMLDKINWIRTPIHGVQENDPPTGYHSFKDIIYLAPGDENIYQTIQHEYGHAILRSIYGSLPGINYPGCILDLIKGVFVNVNHYVNQPMSCTAGAFNEGWATAFALAVNDSDTFTKTNKLGGTYINYENIIDFITSSQSYSGNIAKKLNEY